ncbi:hypothetical protein OG760_37310 (plasmid) [Streptomyces sp. NBC_00963]|uniref:hypothetical protein n=1 Tax=Streptomyces sp. NBC_00963 TaxID=2903697 RepID=UPI002F9099AD|nr:hypothetical protein OG760_37310 [Streptomyces sp. NBC_00963]
MLPWVIDIFVAAWITMLDVLVLAGYWLAEGIKQWASERRTLAPTARLWLVLTIAPAGFATAGFGFYRADLLVTATSQIVMAAAVLLVLLLGLGTECARWVARGAERHRLRRERRRLRSS